MNLGADRYDLLGLPTFGLYAADVEFELRKTLGPTSALNAVILPSDTPAWNAKSFE